MTPQTQANDRHFVQAIVDFGIATTGYIAHVTLDDLNRVVSLMAGGLTVALLSIRLISALRKLKSKQESNSPF